MLTDRFGRQINYLRLSVTDRCDFRCVYCMDEDMTFLPRQQVLTLEEMLQVASAFVALGVKKIRLTGGEPLIRNNVLWLAEHIAALPGLDELVLTTNGSRLAAMAQPLRDAGVSRLNISLDSLDARRFHELTRYGRLDDVLNGVDAALAAGFRRIKLNSVILRGRNDHEVMDLVRFALDRQMDISFIEEMPLGAITEHDRARVFVSSDELRSLIGQELPLQALRDSTGGPSRYWQVPGGVSRIGFISPHSHNFCGDCNRVRLTAEGRLLLCLGNEHSVDLRAVLRAGGDVEVNLDTAIRAAMAIKPERHEFNLEEPPQLVRFMNMTGG